jgi:hypothetical protein
MRMSRWVLYDCALVPGMAFGLTTAVADTDPRVLETLGLSEGYEGPVPLSLLIAIPGIDAGAWLVYSVIAIDEVLPQVVSPTLRERTLDEAGLLLGAPRITATVQWGTSEFAVHTRHAPLELLAAWLPNHDRADTAVVRYRCDGLGSGAPTSEVDVTDHAALEALQDTIESGTRVLITGPQVNGRVPLAIGAGE